LECVSLPLAKEVKKIIELKKSISFQEKPTKQTFFQSLLDNAFKLLTPYY